MCGSDKKKREKRRKQRAKKSGKNTPKKAKKCEKKGAKKGEVFQEREAQTVRHLTLRVVHKQNRASQKSSRFKTPSDLVDDASHGVNGDGESEKKGTKKRGEVFELSEPG